MKHTRVAPFDYITSIFPPKKEDRPSLLRASSMMSRKGSTFFFLHKDAMVESETSSDAFETIDLSDKPTGNGKSMGKGSGTYIRYIEPNKTTYKTNCEICDTMLHTDNVVQYNCKHNVCAECTRLHRRNTQTIMCSICKTDIDWIAIQSVQTINNVYSTPKHLRNKLGCAVIHR
jgi:hypothetical protein